MPVHITILPGETRSAKAARQFLVESCAAHEAPGVLEDAQLLVSELVANAALHGSGPIKIRVACTPGQGLKVWVSDADPAMPQLRFPCPHEEGGRGLGLVRTLSSEWGISADQPGKAVWFHVTGDRGPVT